ncbi:hypothetical protein [Paraflavitalea pollutisoli]|uniref:hypothetical protein n=1 Tax=Paraflavitalea pollutisoli TaxID=3034143 RepID=UPI0023EADC83|nr:hypothetical protein [Paraflavitalea sp. H1-2-19X]
MPIRIYPTIIDKMNWLFVQANRRLDNTSIRLQTLTGRPMYEQKTGILQPGQMVSFPLETDGLAPGTYLLQLLQGTDVIYKKKINVV